MSKISEIFSFNLKGWIKVRNTTQAALGHDAGFGLGTIESYCQGLTWPSDEAIEAIADALEINATELFNDPEMDPIFFLRAFQKATHSQRKAALSVLKTASSDAGVSSQKRPHKVNRK